MQTNEAHLTTSQKLNKAQEHHRKGESAEEESVYREILTLDKKHSVALFLLGRLYLALGREADAEPLLKQVVQQHPDQHEARFLLGNALLTLGFPEKAISHYQFLIRLDNRRTDTLNNLGVALQQIGKLQEAEDVLRRVLCINESAKAYFNLGNLLCHAKKADEAQEAYRSALTLDPDNTEVLNNLGTLFYTQGKHEDAAWCYRQATLRKPDFLIAHLNLGNVFREGGKSREAIGAYRRVLALDPFHASAHLFQGMELFALGQLAGAIASYRKSLSLEPDNAAAHNNLGIALLLQGNYVEGWKEYESRLQCGGAGVPTLVEPIWRGEEKPGKTLLIMAEQGAGDTLQFIRYVGLIRSKFRRVTVACQKGLGRLLEESGVADTVEEYDSSDPMTPDYDACTVLMSLPLLSGNLLPYTPPLPYLKAKATRVNEWQKRLVEVAGKRVGITWSGNPDHFNDANRSCPLRLLVPLSEIHGISLVSLQTGKEGECPAVSTLAHTVLPFLTDYAETAAAIQNLDLVITVDTSVAHLAGALGKPVWLLLPFLPDWRWGLGGDCTPWYPTMRLFRQPRPGDWRTVMAKVRAELDHYARQKAA